MPTKKEQPKGESEKPIAAMKPAEPAKPEPQKTFSLFDSPAAATPVVKDADDEEEEILAEASDDHQANHDEELDEAA